MTILGDACEWVGEKIDDLGEEFSDKLEDAANRAKEIVEKLVNDALEDIENIVEDPTSAFYLQFEGPIEVFNDSAITPWDVYLAEQGAKIYDESSEYAEKLQEKIEKQYHQKIELLDRYNPRPEVWVDRFLMEYSMDYPELKGYFLEAKDWVDAISRLILNGGLLRSLGVIALGLFRCALSNYIWGDSDYRTVIEGITGNDPKFKDIFKTKRLPASGKYFITSDLHLYEDGDLDAARLLEVKSLYARVLDYYAKENYTLIENGDIEDYWLEGGPLYNNDYAGSNNYSPPIDASIDTDCLTNTAQYRLDKIYSNNISHYNRINQYFHKKKNTKYYRLFGNHDDVYSDICMIEALGEIHDSIDVYEYIAFDNGDDCIGLVCHGHQTDAWNNEGCTALGKEVTGIASLVRSITPEDWHYLLHSLEDTKKLWNENENELQKTYPVLETPGLSTDSLNEVDLFHIFQEIWGAGPNNNQSLSHGPYFILGHTHCPLRSPYHEEHIAAWRKYLNTGCGVFYRSITGVEWDGSNDPNNPIVRTVAFIISTGNLIKGYLTPKLGEGWKYKNYYSRVS